MISNKTIALSEQRNVAMANLNISLNRFYQAEKSLCHESLQQAGRIIDQHQAVLLDLDRLIQQHQADRQIVTDLEACLTRQKATISQQKATIDNLSQEIKRYQMREMGEQA